MTPTIDGDVLFVLARAQASFTVPRVQQTIGRHSVPGVRRALTRLVGQGIVEAEHVGRAVAYRLNRDHLAADAVVELARSRERFIGRVRAVVESWELPADLVVLFGSAVGTGMRDDSDIDLFVVADHADEGDAWSAQLGDLERRAARWTGNDTRIVAYTHDDLLAEVDPLVDEISASGVVIAGDRALLRRRDRSIR